MGRKVRSVCVERKEGRKERRKGREGGGCEVLKE